ncbi:hypothetical protein J31TS4_13980 [Paenibacillus sp. J31TS4]|uniref:spore germination protein GerPE n=1 Tax=Paenibacillus sp. J31TS4 TaxID=2807195 RepID=UPI001B143ACB|nr:spore germination protein GerPE [Paenibacillus sp. J31TS4]GIP38118.1 hypothetical protein J31TS4_13980 [Paenibacillus sp. J31TS4]
MQWRTSLAGSVSVNVVLFGSSLHVGDIGYLTPEAKIYAVQRKVEYFEGREGGVAGDPLFEMPLGHLPETEEVTFRRDNPNPLIEVGTVRVTSLSVGAVLQVGSLLQLHADSRTKHIRQLPAPSVAGEAGAAAAGGGRAAGESGPAVGGGCRACSNP